MNKIFLTSVLFLFVSAYINAQGIVRGKVTDESGEAMIGAAISLQSNKAIGVLADLDGNFSINITEGVSQTLVVSYVSYRTMEFVVPELKKDQVFVKNFTLISQNELAEVEVVARQVKANEYYMENVKKNSATTIDYISSETMKKTGDANVVAAVTRVSGVSSSGGLITVRGIGDRYVKTTLNGSRIPTLDPLTNNIKLDLFPASLVDNVIITKTAGADLPGDWAGAYLSIETKDYPEKLLVNIESQFGYNNQTTFKDYISSDRSSTDWLGFDSGLRDRKHTDLKSPELVPSTYDEMVALGLGSYYSSQGITNDWDMNSPEADSYFKLGLVQLGLLAPASFNDPVAYQNAKAEYQNSYKKEAFKRIYPDGTDFNNGFANNWNTKNRKAPMNFSQNFSVGNQTKLFGKPLGFLLGLRYGSSINYDPNGVSRRVGPEDYDFRPEIDDHAFISRETNGWSGLLNLAYKINEKNSFSFLFMPNFTGTNDVANFTTIPDTNYYQEGRTVKTQFYEQRKQLIYQVKTEHFIAGPKAKIDFNASYTKGNSIAPDFKVVDYTFVRDNTRDSITQFNFGPTAGDGIKRFYRYLSDNILDSRIVCELPIAESPKAGVRKIKFGGGYQQNDRKQDLYDYVVAPGNSTSTPAFAGDSDLDDALGPDHFSIVNQQIDYVYQLNSPYINHTLGKSAIKSAFAMFDYSLFSWIRLSAGLRVEQASIFSDVIEYHQRGYKSNDVRRANVAGYPFVNPANINETSYLPSANLILKLRENKFAQLNFRLNYSQTLARPSMRELNDAAIYDNEFRTLIYGNSELKTAQVKNYDFRFESYFKNGDNFSLSLFYKDFTDHIEMSFGSGGLTWNNVGKSSVRGIEFEGRKKLIKHLELRANVTLVESNSQVIRKNLDVVEGGIKEYTPQDTINRPMFGQAPYIINGILVYTADSLGLTATVSFNVQGPRLVITGVIPGRPDVYEMPRKLFDIKVSKTLGKHFVASVTVRDILNAPVRRAYLLPGREVDYDSFRYGTNYLLSIAYKF